jgi:hypothetical protein
MDGYRGAYDLCIMNIAPNILENKADEPYKESSAFYLYLTYLSSAF